MRVRSLLVFAVGLVLGGCPEGDLSPYLDEGACNSNSDCVSGFHCQASACVRDGVDAGFEADPCGCVAPESCCEGSCVNLKQDPDHCGSCEKDCKHTACSNGNCTAQCATGFSDCNNNLISDGCEVEGETCPSVDGG